MNKMRKIQWWLIALGLFYGSSCTTPGPVGKQNPAPPNIVYILADDMGYGDPGCYNAASKIPTPHMNRLATEGMRFTDAHSPSAVCTPTRYGILTGRYSWRTRLDHGVLWGYSKPLIEPGQPTVASFLQQNGYRTACLGKWHLGLGWQVKQGKSGPWENTKVHEMNHTGENIAFDQVLAYSPQQAGFDYFFGISGSLDMDPYVYLENNRVTAIPLANIPQGRREVEGHYRQGQIAPGFAHINVLPDLTQKAVAYLEQQASQTDKKPFFLYLPLPAPHDPWVPEKQFLGKSQAGRYGDFVYQVDHSIGRILEALDRLQLTGNTLVIVTSDNGSHQDFQPKEYGHQANGTFRGQKADIWEGGHRVPFIARWPGQIKAGTVSGETICLSDLFATCAGLLGKKLPDGAAGDSYNIWPVLNGQKYKSPIREATVHHSLMGMYAIRQGDWKLILGEGGGGFRTTRADAQFKGRGQLYNLKNDPAETVNLWETHPEIAGKLSDLLAFYQKTGKSRVND